MTIDTRNPFMNFVRDRYRARGWHQSDVAARIGVSQASLSMYLNGQVKCPDQAFDAMCDLLDIRDIDRSKARLAHDLLHVPDSVRDYIARLEKDRHQRDVCDERLERLHKMTGELIRERSLGPDAVPRIDAGQDDGHPVKGV